MADNDLSIRINTSADTSGVKQADDALDDLKKGADDASEALDQTGQEAEESARKIDGTGTSANKTNKALDQTEKEAREASTALNKAGRESGELKRELDDAAKSAGKASTELNRVDGSASRAATTSARFSGESDKATKTTNNFGGAALNAAFFLDDLQYGIRGVVNNIPQLVMGLGMGTGVAGVLGILAVGLNQISQRFDIFGDGADSAAEKASNLALEAGRAAQQARNDAAKWGEANKALKAHEDRLKAIQEEYEKTTRRINENAAARNRLKQISDDEDDAETSLQLANLELDRAEGRITEQEFERERARVRAEAARRAQERADAEAQARIRDEQARAAAAGAAASKQTDAVALLQRATDGLLTKDDREQLEKQRALLAAQAEKARADLAALPEKLGTGGMIGGMGPGPGGRMEGDGWRDNPAYLAARRNLDNVAQQLAELDRKRLRDEAAQMRLGRKGATLEDAQSMISERARTAENWREEEQRRRREAELLARERESRSRVFQAGERRETIESTARVVTLDRQEEEQRRREEERRAEERRRAADGIMGDVGGIPGLTLEQLRHMQQAVQARVEGRAGSDRALENVFNSLIRWMDRQELKDAEIRKKFAEFESRLNNTRTGR